MWYNRLKGIAMIQSTTYARVGLAGNPSDGFNGKTLSACVRNWRARVKLTPSDHGRIEIQRHAEMDRLNYRNLEALAEQTERYGHYGALRLIHATCALFYKVYGVDIKPGHGFDIQYDSNIPRQVGLGGSSAIVVALLNCLYERFELNKSLEERAHLAWAVENEELGITAGLQDRVIQTYGGLVYMDFAEDRMELMGSGRYEPLDYPLPNAFIAYTDNPRKNSGQVHNSVHYLFKNGDKKIIKGMIALAEIAETACESIKLGDFDGLGHLMELNFTVRRKLYGSDAIGDDNLRMVKIASKIGCVAKLPGSGGAVVGLYREEQYEPLSQAYKNEGFECVRVIWDQ